VAICAVTHGGASQFANSRLANVGRAGRGVSATAFVFASFTVAPWTEFAVT